MFRNVTLKCLTEIAGVSVSQYEEQFVTLFTLTMCQLKQVGYSDQTILSQVLRENTNLNLFCSDAAAEHQHSSGLRQWER